MPKHTLANNHAPTPIDQWPTVTHRPPDPEEEQQYSRNIFLDSEQKRDLENWGRAEDLAHALGLSRLLYDQATCSEPGTLQRDCDRLANLCHEAAAAWDQVLDPDPDADSVPSASDLLLAVKCLVDFQQRLRSLYESAPAATSCLLSVAERITINLGWPEDEILPLIQNLRALAPADVPWTHLVDYLGGPSHSPAEQPRRKPPARAA